MPVWLAGGLGRESPVAPPLALDHLVGAVIGERRIAVLVDRVGAEDALAILGREQRLDDVGLLAGLGALNRVDGQLHGLIAVDRVRVGVGDAVLLRVVLEERLAVRRILGRRQGRD